MNFYHISSYFGQYQHSAATYQVENTQNALAAGEPLWTQLKLHWSSLQHCHVPLAGFREEQQEKGMRWKWKGEVWGKGIEGRWWGPYQVSKTKIDLYGGSSPFALVGIFGRESSTASCLTLQSSRNHIPSRCLIYTVTGRFVALICGLSVSLQTEWFADFSVCEQWQVFEIWSSIPNFPLSVWANVFENWPVGKSSRPHVVQLASTVAGWLVKCSDTGLRR